MFHPLRFTRAFIGGIEEGFPLCCVFGFALFISVDKSPMAFMGVPSAVGYVPCSHHQKCVR